MTAGRQTIRAGWYYAARYNGNNGDLIVGCVQSVRTNGAIVLLNLLSGKTSVKKQAVLERRNKRISKPQALRLRALFLRSNDKAKVRVAAVAFPEFGAKKEKPKQQSLKVDPPTSYASRCYAADQKSREEAGWYPGAWVGVNFEKPKNAREKQAVAFVKNRYPSAIAVHVYDIVDLIVHMTERKED